jgi:hypothetical protein
MAMTPATKVYRYRWLLIIMIGAVALCVGGLSWYAMTVPDPFYAEPGPVRTLKRHRGRIDTYIENVYAGRIPARKGGQGYYVLDVLGEHGARYVRLEEGCVVITFEFMPTDAVPTLIYSPRGPAGLPDKYRPRGKRDDCPPGWRVFAFTPIDDNWTYCLWDF